jgi:uncharacterized protein (TIGR02757 family)
VNKTIAQLLNKKYKAYNQPAFIPHDPISVPHRFHLKQDIEISAFFASIFAWGNRTTIINKTNELMRLMDDKPYEFCMEYSDSKLKKLTEFRHRTFNATDLLYCIDFFHFHYNSHPSLEQAFSKGIKKSDSDVENALIYFHDYFFSLPDAPERTRKHIATPKRSSTCKRLNMFLRWMVRKDTHGVDFGIWKEISPSQLICPVDLHVARVARRLKLITRKQTDWLTAVELTANLKSLDNNDPVKFDFALFGMGVMEKYA